KNPATGQRQLSLVSEGQEISTGQNVRAEIERTIGVYGDRELNDYVASIGKRIAATSERPDLPWSFEVMDDPAVNAFALPGGPTFMTRGIMAHFNSEAELAAVLGHEIAHITARHSVQAMSRQQLLQLGLGVGGAVSSGVANLSPILQGGFGILFLQYS